MATEPGLAGAALGAFAPGLDTTAAGLGLSVLGGAGGVGGLGISPQSAGLEGAAYPSGTVGAPAAPASGPVTPALTGGPAPLGGGTGAAGLAGPSGLDAAPTIGPGAGAGSTAPLDLSSTAAAAGPTASAPSTASGGLSGFLANNKGLLTSLGLPLAATAASPLISKFLNPVPQQAALNNLANQEASLASQQQSLSQTLTEPARYRAITPAGGQQVSNAVNDAISSTKARYASLGLSGSTMEADAVANIENQRSAITFNIAQQMAQTSKAAMIAYQALGLQDQVYSQLMNAQVAQDTHCSRPLPAWRQARRCPVLRQPPSRALRQPTP